MGRKTLIIALPILLSVICKSQREIKVDSVLRYYKRNIEVVSNDTVYIYRGRGAGRLPKVKPRDIAYIYEPTNRIKHYWITFK